MKAKLPFVLVCSALVAVSPMFVSHAEDHQSPPPGEKGGRHRGLDARGHHYKGGPGHDMWRELNLTEEQRKKIKAVMESKKPILDAIRDEQMQKMKIVLDEAQKEIRPILTPEQQQVLDDMKKLRESREKLRKESKKNEKSE